MATLKNKVDPALALERADIEKYRIIDETIALGNSPVQLFFEGTTVFVTGGSGFLGKQLIEKLFRSCKIKKMYVLLRPKEQKPLQSRLDAIIRDPLYEKLQKNQPDFVKRIIPVEGDISELRLNMNDETWNTLAKEVNVIFHGAATINFVEPLKAATLTNVRGTREMVLFAKACKNLKAFVHISTAYSHATRSRVGQPVAERFYEAPVTPGELIQLADEVDDKVIEVMTPRLLKDWPNTYAFTKAVAEEVVRTMAGDLPICVVRPAIVMGSLREPPGWVDKSTINGPTGFLLGACLGGLHVMYGDPKVHLDLVPVDYVNNAIIVAAYETGVNQNRDEYGEVKIYTLATVRSHLNIERMHELIQSDQFRSLSTPKIVWYGYCIINDSKLLFFLLSLLLHFVPGYLADGFLMFSGKKTKAVRLFTKAYKMNKVYGYFMTNEWSFDDSKLLEMYKKLTPEDQVVFACDTGDIKNWVNYLFIGAVGVRKYILKDGLKNTEYGVKKQKAFKILNIIFLTGYAYVLWKLFAFIGYWFFIVIRMMFNV